MERSVTLWEKPTAVFELKTMESMRFNAQNPRADQIFWGKTCIFLNVSQFLHTIPI